MNLLVKNLLPIVIGFIATNSGLMIIDTTRMDNSSKAWFSAVYFVILLIVGAFVCFYLMLKNFQTIPKTSDVLDLSFVWFSIFTGFVGIFYFQVFSFLNFITLLNILILFIGLFSLVRIIVRTQKKSA